jgi:hypothetical protein
MWRTQRSGPEACPNHDARPRRHEPLILARDAVLVLSRSRAGGVGQAAELPSKFAMLGIITISATKVVAYLRTLDLFPCRDHVRAVLQRLRVGVVRRKAARRRSFDPSRHDFACGMRNISVGVGTGFSSPDLLLPVVVVHALSASLGFDLGVPVRAAADPDGAAQCDARCSSISMREMSANRRSRLASGGRMPILRPS